MKLENPLGPVRELLGGMHQTGTTLIRRGTAMGPLIPVLLLVPVLFAFAWLFSDVAVIANIPVFSALCMAAVWVIFGHTCGTTPSSPKAIRIACSPSSTVCRCSTCSWSQPRIYRSLCQRKCWKTQPPIQSPWNPRTAMEMIVHQNYRRSRPDEVVPLHL